MFSVGTLAQHWVSCRPLNNSHHPGPVPWSVCLVGPVTRLFELHPGLHPCSLVWTNFTASSKVIMVGEALDWEPGPKQILLLHQDTPVLEHARGHVARSRPPAYSVSFVLYGFLMPLENNLKKIYATPVLVMEVLRYVGYNIFQSCNTTEHRDLSSFSGSRWSVLAISTGSPRGLSSMTFKTTVLFWSLTGQFLLLIHCVISSMLVWRTHFC